METKYDFELNSETKQLARPLGSQFTNSYFYDSRCPFRQFVNRKNVGEVKIAFSDKLSTCGLKEGIKAVRLL
jgi:hypothetical protein